MIATEYVKGWWHTLPVNQHGQPHLRYEDGRLVSKGVWLEYQNDDGLTPQCGVAGMHASDNILSAIEWSSQHSPHMRLCKVTVENSLDFDANRRMVAGAYRYVDEWIDFDTIAKPFAEGFYVPKESGTFGAAVVEECKGHLINGTALWRTMPAFAIARRMINVVIEACEHHASHAVAEEFRERNNALLNSLWDGATKL